MEKERQDSAELQLARPWLNLEYWSENTNFLGNWVIDDLKLNCWNPSARFVASWYQNHKSFTKVLNNTSRIRSFSVPASRGWRGVIWPVWSRCNRTFWRRGSLNRCKRIDGRISYWNNSRGKDKNTLAKLNQAGSVVEWGIRLCSSGCDEEGEGSLETEPLNL